MNTSPASATQAFDGLRAEVEELGQLLRKIATANAERVVPDYDLTLGEMMKRLAEIKDDLRHLDVRLPPLMACLPGENQLTDTVLDVVKKLNDAAGIIIQQQAVRWWLGVFTGIGMLVGILLCLGTVALLPRSTGAWMAATIVGGDPWTAGQTLMRQGDPSAFQRILRLNNACPPNTSVALCEAAMAVSAAPGSSAQPTSNP